MNHSDTATQRFLFVVFAAGCTSSSDAAPNHETLSNATSGAAQIDSSPPPQTLVRELSIGQADGPIEYSLSYVGDLAIGSHNEIFVWEYGSMRIREYDSTGKYVRTIGRTGSGPGEYARGLNGIAYRIDGKLLAWDAGNARVNVYGSNGKFESQFSVPAGSFTRRSLFTDTAGNSYLPLAFDRFNNRPASNVFLKFDHSGALVDTVRAPGFGMPRAQLVAARGATPGRSGGMQRILNIPYFPEVHSTIMRNGDLVTGASHIYSLQTMNDGVVYEKISRNVLPPIVEEAERAEQRERTLASLRQVDPFSQWTGPEIPRRKPTFKELLVDEDDRIWVQVSQPSERIPENERAQSPTSTLPPRTWREPVAYDVLRRDGTALGHVRMPKGTTFFRARGDRIWTTMLDSMDIPTITVFRLEPGLGR